MNIEEYKNKRIKEIDEFMVSMDDLKTLFSVVLENPNEYSHNEDEQLTKKFFHFMLKNAILGLQGLYTELKDTSLDIDIKSIEEVDQEIDKFVKNVMIFIDEFADYMLTEYYKNIEKVSKGQSNNINTSLSFYKFKIGNKIYDWYDSKKNKLFNVNGSTNECVVSNLKEVLEYVRDFPKKIRTKLNRLEELQEIGTYFEDKSPEWNTFMNLYFSIRRSDDPKKIEEMYKEAKLLIPTKHR